jgi:ketosteroid isomerase-like protein
MISELDRRKIEALYIKYNRAADTHDVESRIAVYAPDAIFQGNIRLSGHAEIREFAQGQAARLQRMGYGRTQHRTTNLHIEGEGERAYAECDLLLVRQPIDGRKPYDYLVASYRDELHQVEGEWRFSQRVVEWWPSAAPVGRERTAIRGYLRRVRRWFRKAGFWTRARPGAAVGGDTEVADSGC